MWLSHVSRRLGAVSDHDTRGSGALDLNLLRTFLAVHRLGSFTAAARRLGLSQSTVTTQIRALENRLGRELFERRAQGVTPLPHADELATRLSAPSISWPSSPARSRAVPWHRCIWRDPRSS